MQGVLLRFHRGAGRYRQQIKRRNIPLDKIKKGHAEKLAARSVSASTL